MRREAPEHVLLAPDPAKVQPVRVDVLQPAQLARLDHLLQLQECRMVLEQMANHDDTAGRRGGLCDPLAIGDRQGQRLLDEDVLAVPERRNRHLGMLLRRRGQHHRIDVGVGQHRLPVARRHRMLLGERRGLRRQRVDHGIERAERCQVAHQIATPMAAAGDRDPRRITRGHIGRLLPAGAALSGSARSFCSHALTALPLLFFVGPRFSYAFRFSE